MTKQSSICKHKRRKFTGYYWTTNMACPVEICLDCGKRIEARIYEKRRRRDDNSM